VSCCYCRVAAVADAAGGGEQGQGCGAPVCLHSVTGQVAVPGAAWVHVLSDLLVCGSSRPGCLSTGICSLTHNTQFTAHDSQPLPYPPPVGVHPEDGGCR
jgi:hypothetical protein